MALAAVGVIALPLLLAGLGAPTPTGSEISFQQLTNELLPEDKIAKLEVVNGNRVRVYLKDDATRDPRTGELQHTKAAYTITIGSVETFEKQLEEVQRLLEIDPHQFIPVTYTTLPDWGGMLANWLPPLLLVGFLVWMTRSSLKAAGGPLKGMFDAASNPAKLYNKETGVKLSFSDVAGLEEAKEEIMEFVSFLKFPEQYRALGAKIPKGALLVGPPGTGKTLLAKATAGEASVPFYSVSGSDFIEMYVGVGPARVRGLFEEARKNAPCIVFIDEIDAVGRARGKGKFKGGGNDERENTLNQLLVEMDGFNSQAGIVVLAGTNRPDILDRALLRPGRFDRQIALDKPDVKSREAIFLVHLSKVSTEKPAPEIAPRLAQLTPGFSGADIANVCNEAALIAARHNKLAVDEQDFEAAIDRVIGGLEKKNKVLNPEEKRTVAYHEAGHAVAAWFLRHCDPLLKVSIVPRGQAALGYAQYLPKDTYLVTQEELFDRMCMALGGRIAEQLEFQKMSTGASDDLDKVTRMAYSQVIGYGMNERVGPIAFNPNEESSGRPYSENLAEIVDEEVREMVKKAYATTRALLQDKYEGLKQVAELLLQKEKIRGEDLEAVLGPRPFKDTALEDIRHLLPAGYDEMEKAREKLFHDERERIQQREQELREAGGSSTPPSATQPQP